MSPQTAPAARTADYLVVGGGIAGASVAHSLAAHGRVILLERESQPGYHSTGRSAAVFMESYGTPQVRALTMASRAFFTSPPAHFGDDPLLTPRGAVFVANFEQAAQLDAHWQVLQSVAPQARRLSAAEAQAMVPVLRPERVLGAVFEPDASDMDVHAIHQGFLRGMRRQGGELVCDAEVTAMHREGDQWQVHAGGAVYQAPVVVNAAGAWADALAALAGAQPIGLEPRRRSAFIFAPPEGVDASGWPMVIGADEDWYMKPDAGMLLGSPANADPVDPQDVQPEEMDIAIAIHRLEEACDLSIRRPTRTWAGLRSFVADGDLVGGYDDAVPGFFWVAAQGGYGIQTSPAMGETCAALVRGLPVPAHVASFGLTAEMLSPARLRARTASLAA
ncbi:FAD-dependent oxidoreductase [Variovorax dokdonensis]|uniref:FAD-dependent oxidoreductase n=1 Tax=Variovorax dokdonensis TaxID=344883 RepID=A0ABT7NAG3_9BURK|nr:FAD-dependent oxidoreductase [Variovorax dokdonensis]MDM0044931.1 FAD-dependent oxidoreductase [Variovorax dokdonensis]